MHTLSSQKQAATVGRLSPPVGDNFPECKGDDDTAPPYAAWWCVVQYIGECKKFRVTMTPTQPVPRHQITAFPGGWEFMQCLAADTTEVTVERGITTSDGTDATEETKNMHHDEWNVGGSLHVDYTPPASGGVGGGIEGHTDHTFNDDNEHKTIEATKEAIANSNKHTIKATYTQRANQNCLWQWIQPLKVGSSLRKVHSESIARTAMKSVVPKCRPGCGLDMDQKVKSTYQLCKDDCE